MKTAILQLILNDKSVCGLTVKVNEWDGFLDNKEKLNDLWIGRMLQMNDELEWYCLTADSDSELDIKLEGCAV